MVGILKIQLGRLGVFSGFLLFDMSFEALFMWGLGCIEAEFLLNNFQCIWDLFFHTKRMGEGRGTRKILKIKCSL
jgi:hypothetical protein